MARLNPPLPILTLQTYKMVLYGQLFGQSTVNTFYFIDRDTSHNPASSLEMSDFCSSFWNSVKVPWKACVTDEWGLSQIVCYNMLHPEIAPGAVAYDPAVEKGTHIGTADTSFVAANLRRFTGLGGQHGRGGIRIAGVPTSEITINTFTNAYKTKLIALEVPLSLQLTSTINPALKVDPALAKTTQYALPVPTVRGALVNAWTVNPVVSTQRTRRPRPIT